MPVLAFVRHLTYVNTNRLTTGVTVLCIQPLKTLAAERVILTHDVPLTTQRAVALKAAEMLHVPATVLSFCALLGEDDLKEMK